MFLVVLYALLAKNPRFIYFSFAFNFLLRFRLECEYLMILLTKKGEDTLTNLLTGALKNMNDSDVIHQL